MVVRNKTNTDILFCFSNQELLIKKNSCLNIDVELLSQKIIIKPNQKSSLRFFILGALIEGFFDTSFILPRQVCSLEILLDIEHLQNSTEIAIYDNTVVNTGKVYKFSSIELRSVSAFVNDCLPQGIGYHLIDNKKLKKRFILFQLLLSSGLLMLIKLLFFNSNFKFKLLVPLAFVLFFCLLFIPTISSINKFTKFCTTENCDKMLRSNYKQSTEPTESSN